MTHPRARSTGSASQAATLTEVAQRAGVSLATASRVLNGSARAVGAELRERVMAVAAELDYVPNVHAQAIARGTSNVVGLIVHDISDPYFSAIAAGAMRAADEQGLIVALGTTLNSPERELDYVAMLRAQRARAVILAGSRTTNSAQTRSLAREVRAFRAGGGRVACISQNRLGTDTVAPENQAGAAALAKSLLELGHRHFAVLAGPPTVLTAKERLNGFQDGLRAGGVELPEELVLTGPFTRDGGYDAARRLIRMKTKVTCVFAVNDVMAVGAQAAFRERGLRVPEDISVAGFDDISTLRDISPALTTVRLPLEEMGRQAAQMALDPDAPATPRVVRVPGTVVLRESTRRLK